MTSSPSPASPGRSTSALVPLLLVMMTVLGVFYAIRLLFPQGQSGEGVALEHPAVGLTLPGLQLQPVAELQADIRLSDLEGQVALVNFWGTWCPPCLRELPHMEALYQQYRDEPRFRLLAVSCGPRLEAEEPVALVGETERFLARFDFELPAYLDREAVTRRMLVNPLYVPEFAYPTTLVVDGQGTIRGVWVGYLPGFEQEMAELIAALLAES